MANKVLDTVLVYQFIKRLIAPFDEWPAFKLGIIDAQGNVLKKKKDLRGSDANAWGYYDILLANLKKLLAKVPGGKSKLGSVAAMALLLKEQEIDPDDVDLLANLLDKEMSSRSYIKEEMAANAIGGGKIAGSEPAGDDPPVRKKAWDKHKRKNQKGIPFSKSIFARNNAG